MVTPLGVLEAAWLVWLASWYAAALWTNRTARRPAIQREFTYRALTIAGTLLLFGFYRNARLDRLVWRTDATIAWAAVALGIFGLLFTWWARIYLGRMWSSSVTRKVDHRLVDTGPYAYVRHPIYTGVMLATIATALVRGTAFAVAGLILMTAGWYTKARLEEEFLREQLGAEIYAAYARRVAMLVPYLF